MKNSPLFLLSLIANMLTGAIACVKTDYYNPKLTDLCPNQPCVFDYQCSSGHCLKNEGGGGGGGGLSKEIIGKC